MKRSAALRKPAPVQPGACLIEGARTHNLKGITCRIPFGRLTVITGVSGSGKSSLAFDTLYAEGQRRFVDCLSTYARQFLQRLDRPDADHIGEIQPPVAVKQENLIRNARSTVSSVTEVGDYLHLLFAHAGAPHCLDCGTAMVSMATEDAVERLLGLPADERIVIAAPLAVPSAAAVPASGPSDAVRFLIQRGHTRLYHEGQIIDLTAEDEEKSAVALGTSGEILLVVDRMIPRSLTPARAREAVETAWQLGHGRMLVFRLGEAQPHETLVHGLTCPSCGRRADLTRPQLFSPNSPLGACSVCQGFGRAITLDRDKAVPDRTKSLKQDAVVPFSTARGEEIRDLFLRRARRLGVPVDLPFDRLSGEQQEWVFRGDGMLRERERSGEEEIGDSYPGVEGFFRMLERKRYKAHVRIFLARFRGYVTCPACGGSRRKAEALAVKLGGLTIAELEALPIGETRSFLRALDLPGDQRQRVASLLEELDHRLTCLIDSGVGYLTLGRTGRTLSGGETQRIRLASALGSSLTDTLYILDEPTAGLHAVDTGRILGILRRLCATGNTVVVVEHDPAMVEGADHLIVLGPSGGEDGGELLYEGPVGSFQERWPDFFRADLAPAPAAASSAASVTARASRSASASAALTTAPARPRKSSLLLTGIRHHNVDIPFLEIPLDRLTVLTGVSGSGKSTLLEDVLYRNCLRRLGKAVEEVGRCDSLKGLEQVSEVLLVSQNPLGRSTRSNIVTFTGLYNAVRTLLARTPKARALGLGPGAFSFNVPGGRCEICQGMGTVSLEMHFLADVQVACEACKGRRFHDDVLAVTWRGKNVLQILDLTVEEATRFLDDDPHAGSPHAGSPQAGVPSAGACLAPLIEVGLGYCRLGQSTTTLSGGEAQRLKIAALLAEAAPLLPRRAAASAPREAAPSDSTSRRAGRRSSGSPRRLLLFDEPTTGLHPQDIRRLLAALRRLLSAGNGIVVVEHQLDFIRSADHVIDLGPGGGHEGGRLLYAGPVAGLLGCEESITGRVLSESARIASSKTDGARL